MWTTRAAATWDYYAQSGSEEYRGSFNETDKGWDFEGVFLPAAGYRNYDDGDAIKRGVYGYFWPSSVGSSYAWFLFIGDSLAAMDGYDRAIGYSVRCVLE